MFNKIRNLFLATSGVLIIVSGCKKWDDHNHITEAGLGMNLLEQIQANPDLSKFAELLSKSGYADSVASSKSYTVYAPTNAAIASVASDIVSDTAILKKFVANHIAKQAYYTFSTKEMIRVPMLNGKYHDLTDQSIDGVAISVKDKVSRNGVLQIVSEVLPVLNNTWDFAALDIRMPAAQKVMMVDSLGNLFRTRVHNLRDESIKFTLFVLQDNAWNAEVTRFKPYSIVLGNNDSTTKVASWLVAKDLAIEGLYTTAADIPDTIVSKSGVRVGIDKSAITASIKTSNGMVYILNKLEVPLQNKFRDIVIEAENYTSASANRITNTFFRDKIDSATGSIFRDVLVYNHSLAMFNLRYRLTEIPSIKYRAYWMALHDRINNMTTTFQQKISVDSFNSPLPAYVTVPLNTYAEQFAGEFTLDRYKPTFNLYLTAANSTSATLNPIVCNYIRLVPVF